MKPKYAIPFLLLVGMLSTLRSYSQYTVTGVVLDESRHPLVGATVVIAHTYTGVTTDANGHFSLIKLTQDTLTLTASYLGFSPSQLVVTPENRKQTLEIILQEEAIKMKRDVVITAAKASEKTPVAYQDLDSQYIQLNNIGVDIPILMDQATSVVTTSDAGNGIGYAGMRIRGSDATRVNVTVNGVPFNDQESQATFFVNMPDLLSSAGDVQIQRGVGTSTNGSGAFGASVNINTTQLTQEAYGRYTTGWGSFNTFRNTLAFGTGLTKNHFSFDGRLSSITSDGYIQRATANLKAYYAKAGYYGEKFSAKFITFGGNEQTYQAWWGAPNDSSIPRNFNPYDYPDQVDNYSQTFYQLHLNYLVSERLKINITGYSVLGKGYYEEYKGNNYNTPVNIALGDSIQTLADYGMAPVIIGGDTIYQTNLVRRKWLDNTFNGLLFNLVYDSDRAELILGGGASKYVGDHFGQVIWAQYASNSEKNHEYYRNQGVKNDWNVFGKLTYDLTPSWSLFGDAQVRGIQYTIEGMEEGNTPLDVNANFLFVNPKAGISWKINDQSSAYVSFARANHEPNRSDFVDANPGVTPVHESLNDYELGYRYQHKRWKAVANGYYMDYSNQLVLTGAVNDVGGAVRQNVANSYRMGLELEANYLISPHLSWNINGTFSQNKIQNFTQYVDDWLNGGQIVNELGTVDIAFSPNIIAGSNLTYSLDIATKGKATSSAAISLISKYVGNQYMDNTSSSQRQLNAYFVNDLRFTYEIAEFELNRIQINFTIRNLFSTLYTSNAWVYTYNYGANDWDPSQADIYSQRVDNNGNYQQMGLFNQADRNFMVTLLLDF